MTAANLVTVYCDACGPGGSELATANTALAARRQLTGQGWQVNVREVTANRRLDFCPLHKGGRSSEHPEPDEHPHEPWPANAPTEMGDLIAALRASVEAAKERRKAEADKPP